MYYTGKGDDGNTILFGTKRRLSKKDLRIEILGTFDELNSYIGLCKAVCNEEKLNRVSQDLEIVQNHLFSCQAKIAGAKIEIRKDFRDFLEQKIAEMEKSIPRIKNFIIPGTNSISAHLDIARAITRRLERKIVWLKLTPSQKEILPYINRLSSFLFVLARLVSAKKKLKETNPKY